MEKTILKSFYIIAEVDGVLTSTVGKRFSVDEFRLMLIELKETAIKKKINKLLVNITSVDFKDLTMSERHDLGFGAAEILKGDFKGACVIQKEFINKHAENVANNRGANVLVVDTLEEAYKWLKG